MSEPIRHENVVQNTLSEAWNLFAKDFVLYVLAGLLLIVVSILSLGLLSGTMSVGFIQLVERRRRGEAADVTEVFDGFSQFGPSVIAAVLIAIGMAIGFFFYVLPGLLFGLVMIFTYPAIAIDDETATGAMSKSYFLVAENFSLAALFLIIVAVLSGLGGAFVLGTVVTLPFSLILTTLAYHRLCEAKSN